MNRVVIVTGGSRGIGAATSLRLAAEGYQVCVNYRSNRSAAETVVKTIVEAQGEAFCYQADVSQEQDVINLFDAVEEKYGQVHYLVNNAGQLMKQSSFMDLDLNRFESILRNNLTSCFLCCREFIRRAPISGSIVNVSSVAARTGSPFEYIDYASAKGGMDTLTRGLALELASQPIRVNAVRPGFIYTEMHADGGEPGRVDRLAPNIPMQRGGSAEEVANTIAWLLSDDASYVTGSFIDVAGGR